MENHQEIQAASRPAEARLPPAAGQKPLAAVPAPAAPPAVVPPAAAPPAKVPGRYAFSLPENFDVSDMLAVQLAECVRLTQTLSDEVITLPMQLHERSQTIRSLGEVVAASGDLAESIDRSQGGTGWQAEQLARRKVRKS
ncbi:MAG: hypothetical protein JO056_00955 [Alphaproteobacteria bacterium]|nr:hypothetical protein [Alphaproteobacteria bacterium]